MPILRTMPVVLDGLTRLPGLDLKLTEAASAPQYLSYPKELFLVRTRAVQDYIQQHYPRTVHYYFSLLASIVGVVGLSVLCAVLSPSNSRAISQTIPIAIVALMILLFVIKMVFSAKIEKANQGLMKDLLMEFNDQDMNQFSVIYRVRSINSTTSSSSSLVTVSGEEVETETTTTTTTTSASSNILSNPKRSRIHRLLQAVNLALPSVVVDLTTIDHIDEFSFGEEGMISSDAENDNDHQGSLQSPDGGQSFSSRESGGNSSNPHQTPEQIQARMQELPRYQARIAPCPQLPPQYDEVVEVVVDTPAASLEAISIVAPDAIASRQD